MCLYCVIQISCSATPAELQNLKARYKQLALNYHPDRNHGNEEEAAEKFKQISEAYRILSDPFLRSRYNATSDYCVTNAIKFNKPARPNPRIERKKKVNPRNVPKPHPHPPPPSPPSPPDEEADYYDDDDDDDPYYDDYLSSEDYLVSGKRKGAGRNVKTAANWKEMEEAKKKKQVNAKQSDAKPRAASKQNPPEKGL